MYRLSNLAAEDFTHIFEYSLLNYGVQQADKYTNDLKDCFYLLVSNPLIGVDCGGLFPHMRRHTFQSHNIFYLPFDGEIEIVRILHVRMSADFHIEKPASPG